MNQQWMKNKLWIPKLGDLLVLAEDWTFDLYLEERNSDLVKIVEGRELGWKDYRPDPYDRFIYNHKTREWENNPKWCDNSLQGSYPKYFTLLLDTILKIDRIYIRKNSSEFDSVSFFIFNTTDKRFERKNNGELKRYRFWAKLDDVNRIVYNY